MTRYKIRKIKDIDNGTAKKILDFGDKDKYNTIIFEVDGGKFELWGVDFCLVGLNNESREKLTWREYNVWKLTQIT